MTDHFLSTSAHYPRSWSRNNPFSTLKLACLNGKFLTSGDGFTSMAFDRKILRGVRRQVLYSHHVNCTAVPWGSLSLSVIPLALVNSLHHWLVIKRCLSMFDFRTFLTWIDLYLEWRSNEFEDPGSSFIHPGCDIYSGHKDIWYVHHCNRWSSFSKDDKFSRELSVKDDRFGRELSV